jgi:uncharacterized protein YhfF
MMKAEIDAFWRDARDRGGVPDWGVTSGPNGDEFVPPQLQWFGATPEQADESLDLVLRGIKTATSAPLRDYEAEGENIPAVGDLAILLDGGGHPRALLRTTQVDVVRFDKVSDEHAYAEGEGDRSLTHWRDVHEWFFKEYDHNLRGFAPNMLVVCERFEVLVPTQEERQAVLSPER